MDQKKGAERNIERVVKRLSEANDLFVGTGIPCPGSSVGLFSASGLEGGDAGDSLGSESFLKPGIDFFGNLPPANCLLEEDVSLQTEHRVELVAEFEIRKSQAELR